MLLFESEDHQTIESGNYKVMEICSSLASKMVKKYHYSKKTVSNSQLHLGIFESAKLVGVLSFGPPMNGDKTSLKISSSTKMYELNRMVMDDDQPRNSESRAISLCIRWLKRFTDIEWLLSFSDGKEGNVGYIYQATNWNYLGYLLSDSFYELDGKIKHSVTVWHQYKEKHPDRDIKTTHEILTDTFKNVKIIVSKQHIYVYPLKRNVSFEFCKQTYPKLETEVSIVCEEILKSDGVIYTQPLVKYHTDKSTLKSIW